LAGIIRQPECFIRERDDRAGIVVQMRICDKLLMIEQIPQLGGETGAKARSA
jgi:hypothetical protein